MADAVKREVSFSSDVQMTTPPRVAVRLARATSAVSKVCPVLAPILRHSMPLQRSFKVIEKYYYRLFLYLLL